MLGAQHLGEIGGRDKVAALPARFPILTAVIALHHYETTLGPLKFVHCSPFLPVLGVLLGGLSLQRPEHGANFFGIQP